MTLQHSLRQGFPSPGTGPRPVRNRAAQQEVSGGQAKLHLLLSITPHHSRYRLNKPYPSTTHPTPVRGKIVFHETGPWCQKTSGTAALRDVLPDDKCDALRNKNVQS